MRYEGLLTLERFREEVERALLAPDRRRVVNLPTDALAPWDGDALVRANQALLSAVSGKANLYALFTGLPGDDAHRLRYIGKTTRKLARQRVTNHLFRKDERTGSKLSEVVRHVGGGTGTVQIAWIAVEPESLRNYVEEELILAHPEADWNRENRATAGAGISRS